jgi:predicted GTPase
MSEQDIAEAQQRFRELVSAHWAAVANGQPQDANRKTDELNRLVTSAAGSGKTSLLLGLLAEQESTAVKVAAATYALRQGHEAEAVPVLEAIADDDDAGLEAEDADMALMEWRQKQ